jgi:hypothetical protein
MLKNNNFIGSMLAIASLACLPRLALAQVSAEEAKQLGTKLTEFGAEKAGNADGSIPAYTGGLTQPPAGWARESGRYDDPFAGEKPLYSVTAKNMAQYANMLTEGNKAMLARFPDTYRLDVYPTHRTVAYPAWVLKNTVKNATTARLTGKVEGDAVAGVDADNSPFPGIPFPVPKNGVQVLWNYNFHYTAPVTHTVPSAWLVDTAGRPSPLPTPNEYFVHPWYEQSGKLRKETYNAVHGLTSQLQDPPSSAGIVFLNYYMHDAADAGQKVWFYTPGQRRVRAAPEFAYDIPIASYGGVIGWDEIHGFTGRMDRFDFKLIGKKEMLVPYNVYGITNQVLSKDFLGPQHVNPAAVRFEKRRVWVVDATRKPNARHVYSRRTFYVEEDCWCIVAAESYDNGGKLWKNLSLYTFPTYDVGGINNDGWGYNDLIKGNYTVINVGRKDPGKSVRSYLSHEGLSIALSPQAVAGSSVR